LQILSLRKNSIFFRFNTVNPRKKKLQYLLLAMSHAFDPVTHQRAKLAQHHVTPQLRFPTHAPTDVPFLTAAGKDMTVTVTPEKGYGEFTDTSGLIISVALLGLVILCFIGYQLKRNLKWTVEGKPVFAADKGRGSGRGAGGAGKLPMRREPTRGGGVDVESGLEYQETDSLLGLDREYGSSSSSYGGQGKGPMAAGGSGAGTYYYWTGPVTMRACVRQYARVLSTSANLLLHPTLSCLICYTHTHTHRGRGWGRGVHSRCHLPVNGS